MKAEQGPLFSAMADRTTGCCAASTLDGMAAISAPARRLNAGASSRRPLARLQARRLLGVVRPRPRQSLDLLDHCPDQPGTKAFSGCPDTDGDGLADQTDNCPIVANADQRDADGDGAGDLCDATPRGDDPDGDGVPPWTIAAPLRPGPRPTAARSSSNPPVGNPEPPKPTPTVTPQTAPKIVSLAYKLSKCPKGKKQCAKVATVTVKVSRQAKVALKVERQDRRRGRLVWKRVKSQSLTATARGRSLKVRGRQQPARTPGTA